MPRQTLLKTEDMKWFVKMPGKSKKKRGFTLIELVIVMVTVAILAAVAIPLYRGYVRKAISTEGVAGLGTIRTGLRVIYAIGQDYTDGGTIADGDGVEKVPGIDPGYLNGTYFDQADYKIDSITSGDFTLQVTGAAESGAGNNTGKANGITITMDHEGTISGP